MTTTNRTSHPIALRDATVTDPFWASRQELVRTQVIPYQWNALNDNVPGAAPSYCMHNFKAAAAQNAEHHKEGKAFVPPKYTFRGFEALPDDPAHPDPDKFYGFVFQDTDFSKWIEAVGYSLTHHPDADLEATADTAIDIVCAAQLDNGYLDTYYILNGMDRHFTNLKDQHELMRDVAYRAAEEYGVEFYYQDFRPMFRDGQARARELGFYMQKYCGCVFSEQERYQKPSRIIP